jgi:hypothetical protein
MRIHAETIPGTINGTMMRRMVVTGLAPQTADDSSIFGHEDVAIPHELGAIRCRDERHLEDGCGCDERAHGGRHFP